MPAVQRTVAQVWAEHRKARLVVAAMWGLLLLLISLAVAAEPLKVGGLPVT